MGRICQAFLIVWISLTSANAFELKARFYAWQGLLQGRGTSEDYLKFIKHHPQWPFLGKLKIFSEKDLYQKPNPKVANEYCRLFSPLTAEGVWVCAQNNGTEKNAKIKGLIKKCWHTLEGSKELMGKIYGSFSSLLDDEDHKNRINYFLNRDNPQAIKIVFDLLSPQLKEKVRLRLEMVKEGIISDSFTPSDEGLVFELIRTCRVKKEDSKMMTLLQKTYALEKQDPEPWWKERNILARRLIEEKKFQEAYDIVTGHHLKEGEDYANAEWLAGWIALEFLGLPEKALNHFFDLHKKVGSPISKARACFWIGECYRKLKDNKDAETWFKKAAIYKITFYGQMAKSRLQELKSQTKLTPFRFDSGKPNPDTEKAFNNQELVRVLKSLDKDEGADYAKIIFLHLAKKIKKPGERLCLINLAEKMQGPKGGVLITKEINKSWGVAPKVAFPLIHQTLIKKVQSKSKILAKHLLPLAHGIIWRESCFDNKALSPAGAKGLMQLMPATAKEETNRAKKSLDYKPSRRLNLFDPHSNLTLGISHLNYLLDYYEGSYILAIAAYNAGKKAVDEWINLFGDPRSGKVSALNWIELIPYYETRNYVQRVMERFFLYIHRLEGAQLSKVYDMKQLLGPIILDIKE
jgi:soluble lytic murein transglycosylase